jgi:hypothetical protein
MFGVLKMDFLYVVANETRSRCFANNGQYSDASFCDAHSNTTGFGSVEFALAVGIIFSIWIS